jgi:hypothetical protein
LGDRAELMRIAKGVTDGEAEDGTGGAVVTAVGGAHRALRADDDTAPPIETHVVGSSSARRCATQRMRR